MSSCGNRLMVSSLWIRRDEHWPVSSSLDDAIADQSQGPTVNDHIAWPCYPRKVMLQQLPNWVWFSPPLPCSTSISDAELMRYSFDRPLGIIRPT